MSANAAESSPNAAGNVVQLPVAAYVTALVGAAGLAIGAGNIFL